MALSEMVEDFKLEKQPDTFMDEEIGSTVCNDMEILAYCKRLPQTTRHPRVLTSIGTTLIHSAISSTSLSLSLNCSQYKECNPKSILLAVLRTDNENCSTEEGSSQWVEHKREIGVGCSCLTA